MTRQRPSPVSTQSPSGGTQLVTTPTANSATQINPSPRTQPSSTALIINGRKVTAYTAKQSKGTYNTVTMSKASRALLNVEAKHKYFSTVTAYNKGDLVFKELNPDINDPAKLEEEFTLQGTITQVKDHFRRNEMDDPFVIVNPTDLLSESFDLFTKYNSKRLTADMVADSCYWWANHTDNTEQYMEDLAITARYLENHTTRELFESAKEKYDEFPPEQQGGPLLFYLVLAEVSTQNEEAVATIKSIIENLNISNIPAENVAHVCKIIRAGVKRLMEVQDSFGRSTLPDDFGTKVCKVFMTSSIDEFNEKFKFMLQLADSRSTSNVTKHPDIWEVLDKANATYRLLLQNNVWNGVSAKKNETTFVAANPPTKPPFICYNCGEPGHGVSDCPRTVNPAVVKSNRAKHRSSRPVPKKWQPPTDEEKANGSCRIINGIWHYYDEPS
jgi:Zinc knuckle